MLRLSRLPSGRPEIFASIQGEGPTRGVPSAFVRLALCNLHCDWCDTRYTWDWAHFDRQAETVEMSARAVTDDVVALGHRNVIITGGEPLIQQRALEPFVDAVKNLGKRIEVETNGTLRPSPTLAAAVDQWNVSPKLASSGNSTGVRMAPAALSSLAANPNAYFKFVVCQPQDVREVETIVADWGIPSGRVILMPEAQDVGSLFERARWLVPLSQATGFALSPRLQIMLWGGARAR